MGKKILFVIDVMRVGGGAQRVIMNIMSALRECGHEVKLLVIKRVDQEVNTAGFDVEYALDDEAHKILPNLFVVLEKITLAAKQHDIIVSFIDFIVSYCVALSAKIAAKPYYIFVRCEPSFFEKAFPQPMMNHEIYALCLKGAERVVCNSLVSCEDVVENFGVHRDKVSLLRNPICVPKMNELESTHNVLPKKQEGEIFCLAMGRLHVAKNYHMLLETFANLPQRIKLFVLGEGDERESMLDFIKKHKMSHVSLLGYQANVSAYLREADLFIHPSLSEGCPNTVLEAASLAKPLLLSNIRVHEELFADAALFFEVNDTQTLQRHIEMLANHEEMRRQYAHRSVERVMALEKQFHQTLQELF